MRILLLLLSVLSVAAQTYEFQGWAQNGTVSGATSGYYDKFLPANQPPSGTFWPQVGPSKPFLDPVGTMSFIFLDANCNHGYSSRSLVSTDSTYGYTICSGVPKVYNMKTGALVCDVSTSGLSSIINSINWSALDNARLVYIGGNTVRTYDVETCPASWTTILTFDGTGGKPNLSITVNGTANGSEDDHFSLFDETNEQVCVVDISNADYSCVSYSGLSLASAVVDNSLISKGVSSLSDRRYVLLQSGSAAMGQWYYTTVSGGLTFSHQWECFHTTDAECASTGSGGDDDGVYEATEEFTEGAHSDMGQTEDGRQFYIRACDNGSTRWLCVFWVDLDTAATAPANISWIRRMAATSVTTRNWPEAVHMGCAKKAPVCVTSSAMKWYLGGDPTLSGSYTLYRPLAAASEPYQAYASGWLVEAIYNAGERFKVVAHTRGQMWEGYDSEAWYNSFPRANISDDGRWAAYTTRFGVVDTTQLRTVFANIISDPAKALRVTNKAATTATLRYLKGSVTSATYTVSANSDFSSPIIDNESDAAHCNTNECAIPLGEDTPLPSGTLLYVRVTWNGVNADTSFQTR